MAAYTLLDPCWCVYVVLFGSRIPNSTTYTHQQGPIHVYASTSLPTAIFYLAILTTVTLASTSNALPDDGVTAPKHVGAVLMSI